jgi:hypothetical protein
MLSSMALGQDPAHGWMAYAVGSLPSSVERITRLEMTWTVSDDAKRSGSFYSPWFGMDPADNLNLLQPVNPWGGSSWSMYTEYFQWRPTHNSNSRQHPVKAGQTLHGSIVYDASSDAYTVTQTIVETGVSSSQVVPCQSGKKFTVPYVVYEKTWPCASYPPDGKVTFRDIVAECDGKDCTSDIKWAAKVEDANCDMKAVISSNTEISLTWDTSMASKYDNYTRAQLHKKNAVGWAKDIPLRDPFGCGKLTDCKTCVEKNLIIDYPCYWCEIDNFCHDVITLFELATSVIPCAQPLDQEIMSSHLACRSARSSRRARPHPPTTSASPSRPSPTARTRVSTTAPPRTSPCAAPSSART